MRIISIVGQKGGTGKTTTTEMIRMVSGSRGGIEQVSFPASLQVFLCASSQLFLLGSRQVHVMGSRLVGQGFLKPLGNPFVQKIAGLPHEPREGLRRGRLVHPLESVQAKPRVVVGVVCVVPGFQVEGGAVLRAARPKSGEPGRGVMA